MIRRGLLIAGALVVVAALAVAGTLVVLYLPARAKISSALSAVPDELRPPPDSFVEAASCVHRHGVAHLVARKLLVSEGLDHARAIVWTARYIVWTEAVDRLFPEDAMALYADTLNHKAGVGLLSGARAYFSKRPAELTRGEAVEFVLADADPAHAFPDLLETFKRKCSE